MTGFLRGLTSDQQVGLLFLVVFGLLALATVAGVLLSLRERRAHGDDPALARRRHDNADLLRISWLMAVVFWIGWVMGRGPSIALFGVLSFFALFVQPRVTGLPFQLASATRITAFAKFPATGQKIA